MAKIAGDIESHAESSVTPGMEKCPSNFPFKKRKALECNNKMTQLKGRGKRAGHIESHAESSVAPGLKSVPQMSLSKNGRPWNVAIRRHN